MGFIQSEVNYFYFQKPITHKLGKKKFFLKSKKKAIFMQGKGFLASIGCNAGLFLKKDIFSEKVFFENIITCNKKSFL